MQVPLSADPPEARTTTAVRWLIGINVALYFIQLTLVKAADIQRAFGFELRGLDASWTVVTHMFVHAGFWLLALNMVVLWRFGSRVESRWGTAQFCWYYLFCGLGGWMCYLLFAQQGTFIGASSAVLGVALAYAAGWPAEEMLLFGVIPVTIRWFVAILVLLNMLVGVSADPNAGIAHLAHLGGLGAGWLYLRLAGSMDIDRLRKRVAPVADEPEDGPRRVIPPRAAPRQQGERDAREVDEIVQQSQAAIAERLADATRRHAPPTKLPVGSSSELNTILDKISAHGFEALTQHERDRLQDAAKKLRDS